MYLHDCHLKKNITLKTFLLFDNAPSYLDYIDDLNQKYDVFTDEYNNFALIIRSRFNCHLQGILPKNHIFYDIGRNQ